MNPLRSQGRILEAKPISLDWALHEFVAQSYKFRPLIYMQSPGELLVPLSLGVGDERIRVILPDNRRTDNC